MAASNKLVDRGGGDEAERKQLSHGCLNLRTAAGELGARRTARRRISRQLAADLFWLVGGVGRIPRDSREQADCRAIPDRTSQGNGNTGAQALSVASVQAMPALFDLVQKTRKTSKDPPWPAALYEGPLQGSELGDANWSMRHPPGRCATGCDRVSRTALRSPNTQDDAWQYTEQNWPKVKAQSLRRRWSAGEFTLLLALPAARWSEGFSPRTKVAASANALTRSQNSINDWWDLRAAQSGNLQALLSSSAAGAVRPNKLALEVRLRARR